jgi:hypothetical protein
LGSHRRRYNFRKKIRRTGAGAGGRGWAEHPSEHSGAPNSVAGRVSPINALNAGFCMNEKPNVSANESSRIAIQEIAADLAIGSHTVYQMLEPGIIPGIRLKRGWLFTRFASNNWRQTCGKVAAGCPSTNASTRVVTSPGRTSSKPPRSTATPPANRPVRIRDEERSCGRGSRPPNRSPARPRTWRQGVAVPIPRSLQSLLEQLFTERIIARPARAKTPARS